MIFRKLGMLERMNHFLLIGLGNPGRVYINTRHNIGFLVIDGLAERWGVKLGRVKFKSLMGEYRGDGFKAVLSKPQTYMNLSGFAVNSFQRFYRTPLSNVMVIFDDLDLPFGTIRIRQSGGSSGQKGMKSIIEQLGTKEFPRMRVGIGRPPGKKDAVDFVLDEFKANDRQDLDMILNRCADAVEFFIKEGVDKAMMRYNNNILNGQP